MFVSDGSSIQSQEINVVIEENQEVEKLMLQTSIAEQERLALVVTEQQNQIDELLVDLQEAQATIESLQNNTEQIKNGSSKIAKLDAKSALSPGGGVGSKFESDQKGHGKQNKIDVPRDRTNWPAHYTLFYKNHVNWSQGLVFLKFSFVLNNRSLFS